MDNMPNHLLHLSMDSDNMHKLGFNQTRRLPFGQIEPSLAMKQRHYAGSPPPVVGMLSNINMGHPKINELQYNSINANSNSSVHYPS
jgi:hypothetical protein